MFCFRDLSETNLIKLPTRGLESLEVLKIRETFSMREFPSVLHFPEIREAHLTYPYHCCAFQFPVTHDPEEFERLQSLRDVHRKFCEGTGEQVTTPGLTKRFVTENGQEEEERDEGKIFIQQVKLSLKNDNFLNFKWFL